MERVAVCVRLHSAGASRHSLATCEFSAGVAAPSSVAARRAPKRLSFLFPLAHHRVPHRARSSYARASCTALNTHCLTAHIAYGVEFRRVRVHPPRRPDSSRPVQASISKKDWANLPTGRIIGIIWHAQSLLPIQKCSDYPDYPSPQHICPIFFADVARSQSNYSWLEYVGAYLSASHPHQVDEARCSRRSSTRKHRHEMLSVADRGGRLSASSSYHPPSRLTFANAQHRWLVCQPAARGPSPS
jgi:hypothetical protein